MDSGGERTEQGDGDSEQEETEQYEVERIIDMRTEEGEVLYRVRWKNYASDDDTWEPEAHLEDCREVLLAYKRQLAEAKAKREEAKKMKLPMKSDVFDADSSDSDKDRPRDLPIKKKKKKKSRQDSPPPQKEKRKKKKEKRKDDFRPRPAPESDEEEEEQASSPPSRKSKTFDSKKRVVDSDDEDELPVPSKKHRKDKSKDGGKQHKEKKGKDLKGGKHDVESSEDEVPAPADEEDDELTDDSQMEDSKAAERMEKASKKKSELKLKGFKDFLQDKKKKPETPSDNQKETKKALTSSKSQSRDEAARHSSDSSDSSTLHKKTKSKGQETVSAPPKVPSSASSTSSSSSLAAASTSKAKDEESRDEVSKEKEQSGSTNLFEKFLLNCEAKDRVPRKPSAHPPAAPETSKAPKLVGKIEKRSKTGKDSATQKTDDKAEKPRHGDLSAKTEEKTDQDADTQGYKRSEERRFGEDSRERRERLEEGQRGGERWERRTPSSDVMERRRKREDSEPRLAMSCDDNQDAQDTLESEKSDKGQASLSLGMDLNLDWMTLDEFQKHLNGEDEILSAPPLSPIELRDAVKSGDYMSVKLALNSKEDYNLDQEDSSGMSLCMLAAAGGNDDILRLLIKKGVKVNGRQKNGTTALMHAAEKNFLTTVAILLEAGAYVNAQTLVGETALMKACKRGNADVVRLLLEYGADCNITSKHKTTALYFAKVSSNNLVVYDLIKDHVQMLSTVAEDTIRAYFESRLALLEPVFPLACHRLCEGPDFSLEFGYKPPPHTPGEGSGVILFIFHANFQSEISARLCGPCSVHAVVLNDKFQLPIFLDSHFIYSFSPVPGINKLFIRLAESPTAKVKLLICAYRVQLQ